MFYKLKLFAYPLVLGLLILSTLLVIPSLVFAQDGMELSGLEIDLWPEYDRPAVLVIYRVSLPTGTTLPADLDPAYPCFSGRAARGGCQRTRRKPGQYRLRACGER